VRSRLTMNLLDESTRALKVLLRVSLRRPIKRPLNSLFPRLGAVVFDHSSASTTPVS
jgi:hypothetical protein